MGKRPGDRGGGHGRGGCLVRLRADDCGLRPGLRAARRVAALQSAALQALNESILRLLRRAGIAGPAEVPHVEPLGGGVSSDIWRVDLASGPVCVKCALPRLRVAQVWEAPVERSRYEYEWFRIAAAAVPGAVPQVIAQEGGVLAMQYLDPARHPVWKDLLRKGQADAGFASKVGRSLAAIHSATANQKEVERRFPSDDIFYAIRLEPYLVATAAVHPDLEANLLGLLARTAITKLCLVHGDVSPKNILVGPRGPVFLDAECAWYGDPAFDLASCLAIAPAGTSTGSGEAKSVDVPRAVQNINTRIRDALRALSVSDQAALDRRLIELDGTADKSRLGANAIVAVSLACAHAAAAAAKMPLWRHLAGERRVALPVPQIQIFGGGAHARGRVDVQDYMVICIGAGSFAEALEWTAEVYAAAGARLAKKGALQGVADEGGYWPAFKSNEEALAELVGAIADAGLEPGVDVSIAIDLAATQLYRGGSYHFALDGRALSAEQLHAMLLRWIESYPIVSIEDPFAEHDAEAMRAFTEAAPIQVVGDDFFVTRAAKLRNAQGACNAVLLKPNQVGTVTETLACWEAARAMGYGAIISARSGETEDVSIVHLAVGWGVPQLKVGGFSRSERMAKWNEGLRIEGALGGKALPYPARKLFRR